MPEHKSLEELSEEEQYLDVQLSIAQKKALLHTVDVHEGFKGAWRTFSDNGKVSGLKGNWGRIINRIRGK